MSLTFVQPAIIVHGGAVATQEHYDGCEHAARTGLEGLTAGEHALEAALRAAVVMEDDPRFNAGTGSSLAMDGETIEMDASVMDSSGRFAAVAAISQVKNPVLVAHRLLETPHMLLAGEGARRFAHRCGFPPYDPSSPQARERNENVLRYLREKVSGPLRPYLDALRLDEHWNFPRELQDIVGCTDTIGVVTRDRDGNFGVAASTGGGSLMLMGRVGDVPILGAGLYAGPAGAVTATGNGEEIIRRMLCKQVYDWIADGRHPEEACEDAVAEVSEKIPVGMIALSRDAEGAASNRPMPYVMLPAPL